VRRPDLLPSGTVTFLFTDIEGSTRLLLELGDRYADVLAEHRRVLREAFARHGGLEVDTQGDSFFVAFARASDAVAGAQAGQDALHGGPVRVRMGLHTGEPMVGDEGYVGIDVHRGARLASAGHGGQILLSQTTRDLLDSTFELVDLGLHRLKDLSEPQRLYQLGTEGFAPLMTLHQTNLPVPATPFLGRERELGEVLALLRSSRVLTLTGPGGSGKTRLAIQTAAEAAEDFPAGVWWVPLSTLRDPSLVRDSIARVLGAKGEPAEHIGDKELLLVLDNLEHLLECAPELADLVERCSAVRLLVTSREPLRLSAEQEYAVAPLVSEEAVDFFCARARAAKPEFVPTTALPEICRRLDNLPLALELAAARVKVLSADQILARLEQALPLLTGGRRDMPERQRTLAATIAWSYEMLSDSEQRLFEKLSVFVGGCALEAAEKVCAADVDRLASLVDKSLIRQSGSGSGCSRRSESSHSGGFTSAMPSTRRGAGMRTTSSPAPRRTTARCSRA
jgi:class 3 adenylate cyclase